MKIAHFSDTHLGFNDLDIINEDGINQREADFYKAFDDIINEIKTLKPDYIIHTGDLFHRSSPSNRAISFALKKFDEINALNIPFVLIAGNHSTPRTVYSKPILSIFDNFKNIYCAYDCKYKKFEFNDVVFHALPHLNEEDKIFDELEKIEASINENKKNILMLHCSVGSSYLMSEFGEFVYPQEKEYLFKKMDYVALGHWHGFSSIKNYENVYYCGSSERTSLNDKRNNKGFIFIDLKNKLELEFKAINIRKFKSFKVDANSIKEDLEKLSGEFKGAIIEVIIENLTALKSIDISNEEVKSYFKNALQVVVKREFIQENYKSIDDVKSISLQDYFIEFLEQSSSKEEFDRLKNKADELFFKYEKSADDIE